MRQRGMAVHGGAEADRAREKAAQGEALLGFMARRLEQIAILTLF